MLFRGNRSYTWAPLDRRSSVPGLAPSVTQLSSEQIPDAFRPGASSGDLIGEEGDESLRVGIAVARPAVQARFDIA